MVPAAALGTPAAQQSGGNFNVSVAGTAVGSIPHQIDLKATQLPGGQLSEVSGFAVSPEDVVQVRQGENIVVSTSANLKTHNVKVTNTQGQLMDLLPLSSNTWSLQGLAPGVYKLDVIVDMSSSGIMGAYETVLVILAPEQQPLPPTQYITMIQSVSVRTDIIFKDKPEPSICYFDPEDKACDPDENGKCPPGFGMNEGDRCIPIGKCPDGYGRLDDDESGTCYPKRDIKTCPDGSIRHKFEACPEIPICDENTPPGVTCRDEGDPHDCEPGFVDRGFGCEPVSSIDQCPPGSAPIVCDDQVKMCPNRQMISWDEECPTDPVTPTPKPIAPPDEDDLRIPALRGPVNPEFTGDEDDTPEPPADDEGADEVEDEPGGEESEEEESGSEEGENFG
jgi:hypothetical protein